MSDSEEPELPLSSPLSLPDNKGKLFDHYISVLAATMSDSEEPLESTPRDETSLSEFGEPLPAPLATMDQGGEMDTILAHCRCPTIQKGAL